MEKGRNDKRRTVDTTIAAKRLEKSRQTIIRYFHEGVLEGRQIVPGGHIRIFEDAIEKILNKER